MAKLNKNNGMGHVNMTSARGQLKSKKTRTPLDASKHSDRNEFAQLSTNETKNNRRPTVRTQHKITAANTPEQQKTKISTKNENKYTRPKVKNVQDTSSKTVARIPSAVKRPSDKKRLVLSRRNMLIGAAGIGAIAAGGIGIKVATDKISKDKQSQNTLDVDTANIIKSDDIAEYESSSSFSLVKELSLPAGTLAWANSSSWIVALIPTEKSKPLSNVELIKIPSGTRNVVLKEAINKSQGYEIFDVRACDNGIIWTESNVLSGEWKIYVSSLNSSLDITPICVDCGDSDFDIPKIEVSENKALWLVMPNASRKYSTNESLLKGVNFSNASSIDQNQYVINNHNKKDDKLRTNVLYASNGRMQTPIYTCDNKITITPRAETNGIVYQLTCLDENGSIVDSVCLPQNMKPLEAGYGNTGFHFSFDAIYNYGGGIAGLGTYTPTTMPTGANSNKYNECKWLNFSRVPTAPPCWCNGLFVIRSTSSICAVDMANLRYCILDRPNASDVYGDYLISSGKVNYVVSLAGISDINVSGDSTKETILHIWKPI